MSTNAAGATGQGSAAALGSAAGKAEALCRQGFALHQQGRLDAARELYEQTLEREPHHFNALHLLGLVALQSQEAERAAQLIGQALRINPHSAAAHCNHGNALRALGRFEAAIQSYDQAIALKPNFTEAHYNRANALLGLRRHPAAIESYERAIALKPDHAEAYSNRGLALCELKQPQAALESFERAIVHGPNSKYVLGMRLYTKMQLSDWRDYEPDLAQIVACIERGETASPPFIVLALSGSAALQRKAAEIGVRNEWPMNPTAGVIGKRQRHGRIRIGYFSADFYNHATMQLMAGLFEQHDKSRFEVRSFSFGPETQDEMHRRMVAACEEFIDVQGKSDLEVARLARSLNVDIAIDLKGYTQGCRPGIFALRAAPVQVSYLGYPGTMGAPYMDYLIADGVLIPAGAQAHYSEKILYMPESYQVNDWQRPIADKYFSREELGLPESGFVYCCFNNSYKITPPMFDIWMRVLRHVPGSVLWLYEENAAAVGNLRKEAQCRGVSAERLIFAKRLSTPEHLARHRVADLFLDTLPTNAHTTASDALWAGLPVLTCLGEAFAGRVAGSLLQALGLPELITQSPGEYEALAVQLGLNPERLAGIKGKLAANRLTQPLFDTPRFARHLEAAFAQIHARYQADLPPEHIYVEALHERRANPC